MADKPDNVKHDLDAFTVRVELFERILGPIALGYGLLSDGHVAVAICPCCIETFEQTYGAGA